MQCRTDSPCYPEGIWLHRLMKLMEEAQQKEEAIWITII